MYIIEFSVRLVNVHPKYPKMFSWGSTKKKHVIHLRWPPNKESMGLHGGDVCLVSLLCNFLGNTPYM